MLPLLDTRDLNQLEKKVRELYPHYTPEWRFSPENPDPGTALFYIFAQMVLDTIKRFNQVPVKNLIAFLNMLDIINIASRPASAYVTFLLSSGIREPVFVPAGTRISARVEGEKEPVLFETQDTFLATPAMPVEAYNVCASKDAIIRLAPMLSGLNEKKERSRVKFFDFAGEDNIQQHSLYIGHSELFNISSSALIKLEFKNAELRYKEQSICQRLADGNFTQWMYFGENSDGAGQWYDFDNVYYENGGVVLKKTKYIQIKESDFNEQKCRWLKCSLKSGFCTEVDNIEVNDILAGAEFLDCERRGGLEPDMLLHNDIESDKKGFYPFGENFAVYDLFYIACKEAFSKKDANITIEFDLGYIINRLTPEVKKEIKWKMIMKESDLREPPPPPEIYISNVIWEYWNGNGWVRLFAQKEYEELFACESGSSHKTIRFKCPGDISENFVNNQVSCWIRARVINIRNLYTNDMVYRSPWIENLHVKYDCNDAKCRIEKCLTYNNLKWESKKPGQKIKNGFFRIFKGIDCDFPAVYIGFNYAPLKGPISMFFSIEQQENLYRQNVQIEWEYLRQNGSLVEWAVLKVSDGTKNLTGSGIITFIGQNDFVENEIFGNKLFWIRALNKDSKFADADKNLIYPVVKGLLMNTVHAVQQETIREEMLESVSNMSNMEYTLSKYPVISEELWVDEASVLSLEERKAITGGMNGPVEEIRDELGNTKEFWVKWQAVDDFIESGADSRHFIIERTSGKIRFGDGKYGKVPPADQACNMKVSYKIGGGVKGNVHAYEINTLQNSIAFIDGVFNPEPSGGGCDIETVEDALVRGPQVIKHRNRAVSKSDFEWLAREASHNIARVRCLSNFSINGIREPGSITLVIFAKNSNHSSVHFPELKAQVESYIYERCANIITFPNKINVMEPVRVEISVHAVLVAAEPDKLISAEREAVKKLNKFLDPLGGNYEGNGWKIAEYPHASMFYTLLKSIQGVAYVDKVSLAVCIIKDGIREDKSPEILEDLPYGMILNGKHRVVARMPQ